MYFSKNEKKNVFKNIIFNGLVNNYSSTPSFSFKLRQDRETSLVYQSPSQLLKVFLKKKYQGLNASTSQMDESPHRKKQGDRFLNIFKKNCKEKNLKSKSFLEIGCGTGYILKKLKKEKAHVIGIEPGKNKKRNSNIKILNSFFERIKFKNKFDFVINNAVLEHQINPKRFLKKIKSILKHKGIVFVCVPDYEKQLMCGDPTLIHHEHLSFFTKETLKNILKLCKFSNVKTFNDNLGNLYGLGKNNNGYNYKKKLLNSNKNGGNLVKRYDQLFKKTLKKIEKWISSNLENGMNLGLYGVTPAITSIFSHINTDKKKIFIFDSDKSKQNKYLTGFKNPILHPREINKRKISKIIILPLYYEKEIKNFLINKINFNKEHLVLLSRFLNKKFN